MSEEQEIIVMKKRLAIYKERKKILTDKIKEVKSVIDEHELNKISKEK